jgi:hypothetical protein
MTSEDTGWVHTADLADGAVTESKLSQSAVGGLFTKYYAGDIPANADLNTLTYCQPGIFVCSASADASSLTNCPAKQAFRMEVYNVTGAQTQISATAIWVYLIRKITDYAGREWVQSARTEGASPTWTYSNWVMTHGGSTDGEIPLASVLTAATGFTILEGRAYKTGKLMTLWTVIKKDSGTFGTTQERVATIANAYRALWTMNSSCTLAISQWAAQKTGYLYMGTSSTTGDFLVADNFQASEHPMNIAKIRLTYPLAN